MLVGSLAGGVLASAFSLGTPFVVRGVVLAVMFVVAFALMHDIGFTPPEHRERPLREMRRIVRASVDNGWRVPAVKWLMVQSLFTGGVGIYGFYALQPYLLELYGDPQAYVIAGLSPRSSPARRSSAGSPRRDPRGCSGAAPARCC